MSIDIVIALIIFLGSFSGIIFILIRKFPEFKKVKVSGNKKDPLKYWEFIKEIYFQYIHEFVTSINWNILFQKFLSRIRISAMKVENKSSQLLEKNRIKEKEKEENKEYWEEIGESSPKTGNEVR